MPDSGSSSPAAELREAAKPRSPVRPMMEWVTDKEVVAAQMHFLTILLPSVRIARSGCWEWVGSKDFYGYGKVSRDGKTAGAHRWVWEKIVGRVPDGLELDHLCRVKHCVNPAHLEPVTVAENARRQREDRGLHTCTRHGPKTPTASGYFRCKPCKAERARVRRARIKGSEPGAHGTRASYINYGCRCAACSDAERTYVAARRAARISNG